MTQQIVKYDVTEAAISEMAALYMNLTVEDFEDEKGFAEVELGRKAVKAKRVAVEKQRKVFKSDALEYGRMVDSKAKEISAMLEPIESHLIAEGDKVRNEVARIKAEEEAKEKAKIQGRVDSLLKVGVNLDFFTVATMTDEDFSALYETSKTAFKAEQSRLAAEEKAKEEAEEAARIAAEKEKERLAAERAELEKIQRAQQETEKALQEQRRKLEAEKQEIEVEKAREQGRKDREAFEKQAAENAKVKAEKEAVEKAEREAKEKVRAEAEAARQEALKPDKEKLLAFAQFLQEGITYPELAFIGADEVNGILTNAKKQIYDIGEEILTSIEGL